MVNEWRFKEPKQTAVITLTRILDNSNNVLYVCHDEEGDWQFLDGGPVEESDAATVALHEMVELDSAISLLYDLPIGWTAERQDTSSDWIRFEH